ncbi:sialin [Anoplophora glabripennis]|uniref:sialin n=1 Tax=Anoplophora glabripennis TaxID=217634 RepID=UPI000C791769|nr:sialin [Anoplophora glabripennis]
MVHSEDSDKKPGDENERNKSVGWMFWKKRRYVVSVLAFGGFFNVYSLRVNLSIAIVAMTELKNVTLSNGTVVLEREFDWDSVLQGYILSSFFYGYITTQLIGGYLALHFGGVKIFGGGIAITAALTLVTPWLVKTNVYLLLGVRIIEGIFEGVTFPSIHGVWSKWAPPLERSRLATIAFSGSFIGTVIAMPLSSYLANSFGWPSIFYFFGGLGLLWFLVWIIVVADTPDQDSRISPEELAYIHETLSNSDKNKTAKMPWRAVLTSMPVWAITVSHFSENWGFYTQLTQLPTFMKHVLEFDLEKTGFMSALPYLVMSIMLQFSGQLADWCRVKGYLTTTQVRRVFNCGGFLGQTVFMLSAAFWLSPVGTTLCVTLAVGLGAFAWAGFSVNHLDIAPKHASVLLGLSNTFATLPGIISPILTGYIVTDKKSADDWRIVFYISAGIYLVGAVIYGLFASGEIQPWAIESEPLNQGVELHVERNKLQDKMSYENKGFEPSNT